TAFKWPIAFTSRRNTFSLETSVIGIAQNPFVSNGYSLVQKVSTSKKESHFEGKNPSSAIPFLDVSIISLHHRSETYQKSISND
ncbi:MAG: perilipin family protein, partial [Cyanobacteria bacterium]|nr:perilipin family protein [Cyanobacteriota bacterium]